MRIRRATSTSALTFIKDRLLETGDIPRDQMLQICETKLKEKDPAFLLLVAMDDKNKVLGHLIAYAPIAVNYVFVYEAEYDAKYVDIQEMRVRTMNVLRQFA